MIKLKNMLKDLLKSKVFNIIIKGALENKEILDIVLFGSVARGKENPRDIDLLIIYSSNENADELSYNIRKKLESEGFSAHIISKTYNELFNSEFLARESILTEGFSLRKRRNFSSMFSYTGFILYRYSLKELNNSERMQFYYSLYGRGNEEGVLHHFEAFKFSNNLIMSSIENSENIKLFLNSKKIPYKEIPIMIPTRISSKKFFENL